MIVDVLVLTNTYRSTDIMSEVPSAIDMNVKVPVNLFTPTESDDILFLDTCRKTGQSVNGSAQFQKFFNYYLKRRGGEDNSFFLVVIILIPPLQTVQPRLQASMQH